MKYTKEFSLAIFSDLQELCEFIKNHAHHSIDDVVKLEEDLKKIPKYCGPIEINGIPLNHATESDIESIRLQGYNMNLQYIYFWFDQEGQIDSILFDIYENIEAEEAVEEDIQIPFKIFEEDIFGEFYNAINKMS